jgi:hypothetical protein
MSSANVGVREAGLARELPATLGGTLRLVVQRAVDVDEVPAIAAR